MFWGDAVMRNDTFYDRHFYGLLTAHTLVVLGLLGGVVGIIN